MWKKKIHLEVPQWKMYFPFVGESYHGFTNKWNYFRWPRGRQQWVSQLVIDKIVGREEGYHCHVRPRTRDHLPSAWDDPSFSIPNPKSWKDVTRKRKQWER